ncbi:hypothetical protein [Nocardia niigatensis]
MNQRSPREHMPAIEAEDEVELSLLLSGLMRWAGLKVADIVRATRISKSSIYRMISPSDPIPTDFTQIRHFLYACELSKERIGEFHSLWLEIVHGLRGVVLPADFVRDVLGIDLGRDFTTALEIEQAEAMERLIEQHRRRPAD